MDDSLVRGTTAREIVHTVKEPGATRVLLVSCSPKVIHTRVFGIDHADPAQLITRGKISQEIANLIHADQVIFQDLEDLKAACKEVAERKSKVTDFEVGVFSGQYQTEVPRS